MLSINDVNDVFLSVVRGADHEEYEEDINAPSHWRIGYPGFLECLAKFSELIKIEGTQWDTTYSTAVQRAKLLLDRLDLKSSVRLNATLNRDVHSFSIMVASPSKK
jgi:hypothetical protein